MPAERLELSAPATVETVPAMRQAVAEYAALTGADADAVDDVQLAVSEAVTNAVLHAYPGPEIGEVHLEAWRDDHHQLTVVVSDDGVGRKPRRAGPGLGLGLRLIARTVSELSIAANPRGSGTSVMMRFRLARQGHSGSAPAADPA